MLKNIFSITILSLLVTLTGCDSFKTTYRQPSEFEELPAELEDCKVVEIKPVRRNPITVFRCPLSVTTTETQYNTTAPSVVTVIDEVPAIP